MTNEVNTGDVGGAAIDVSLADVWSARALATELTRELPAKVESWQDTNAQLVSALNAQSVSTAIIRGVVMVVVVLGIASVLVVSVVQKQREIGILRAMGATRAQVMGVFLVQGALVGLVGALVGVLLAAGMIDLFTRFVKGSDGLPLFAITLPPAVALEVALLAWGAGVLAALAPGATPLLQLRGLSKTYNAGRPNEVEVLHDIDLTLARGEFAALIGPSGSGKSTLLKCLGAVIEPSGGRMTLGGRVIYDDGWQLDDLRTLRRDSIGFVFQAPYLIPFLDVTDNVALLPMLAGMPNAQARAQALELLTALDVQHRAQAMPAQLSGGEQQRVAIARALANRPPVILADEPTAPLDSERALAVMRILNQMAVQYHTAIIVVTHDEKIIPTFKRLYHIRDGKTYEEAGQGLVL